MYKAVPWLCRRPGPGKGIQWGPFSFHYTRAELSTSAPFPTFAFDFKVRILQGGWGLGAKWILY